MPPKRPFVFRFPARFAGNEVLAPFQHRIFFAIWLSSLVSSFGTVIQSVGAAWLMTTIAPSADYVALVQAATTAPLMLFALVGGALADTFDRRHVMLTAQVLVLVASLTVALINWAGWMTPWTLLLFTFLIGSATALYTPTWQASVSDMVPRQKIAAAIGLNSVGFNMARSVGPALGGAIIALWSVSTSFFLNAVSVLGLIAVLASWSHRPPRQQLAPERLDRAILSGIRYVTMSQPLRAALLRALLFGLCASALQSLMPLVARDLVHGGPLTFGVLLGSFGVGAMAGGLGSVKLRTRFGAHGLVIGSSASFGLASIVVGLSPWLPLSMMALVVAGACWTLTLSTFNIAVQMAAPRWVAGRAIASYQMCTFGGMAFGSVISGQIARSSGVAEALVFAGVAMILGLVAAQRYSLRPGEALDFTPHTQPLNSLPVLELDPRAGPVIVTLEYRVDPEHAVEFVEAAHKLARLRRGDGASDWTLIQDLDDPERWIERFQSPTWLDHLRRQSRMTVSTYAASEFVRTFHKGDLPVVRRYIERPQGGDSDQSGEDAGQNEAEQGMARPHM